MADRRPRLVSRTWVVLHRLNGGEVSVLQPRHDDTHRCTYKKQLPFPCLHNSCWLGSASFIRIVKVTARVHARFWRSLAWPRQCVQFGCSGTAHFCRVLSNQHLSMSYVSYSLSSFPSISTSPHSSHDHLLGLPLLAFPGGMKLNILLGNLLSRILRISQNHLKPQFSIRCTTVSSVFSRLLSSLLLTLYKPVTSPHIVHLHRFSQPKCHLCYAKDSNHPHPNRFY